MTEQECDAMFKRGEKELKTGFFKFNPDYVSGVGYFTDAAKGYRKLNLFQKSISAFLKAFECNGKMNDYWSAGTNAQDMSEISIFHLNNFDKGLSYLKQASYNFKVGGKFSTSIKAYTDVATKLIDKENFQSTEKVLQEAFNECLEHPEDQLIRISAETVYSKLLDVMCRLEHFAEAIKLVDDMIKVQLQYEENKYKVSKNYIKSAMLRIAVDEGYLVKDIISKMYQVPYSDVHEDIADTQKLYKAIESVNRKDFNFSMQYAFSLFENNLLKAVQRIFEKREQEKGPMLSGDISQIVVQDLVIDNLSNVNSSMAHNETKVSINTTIDNKGEGIAEEEESKKNNNDNEFL